MTAALPTTAVGVFTERAEAEAAVEDLRRAGFREDQIGVARQEAAEPEAPPTKGETRAAEGSVAGIVTGGVVGGMLGAVAAGAIPGVGPIIAVGLLAAVAGGAVAGVTLGGLAGTLIGMGVPETEAHSYAQHVAQGRTLVTVKADGRHATAVAILRRHGALGKGSPLI
jgi:predicted lipid-binding transport protein (Tim44 family)